MQLNSTSIRSLDPSVFFACVDGVVGHAHIRQVAVKLVFKAAVEKKLKREEACFSSEARYLWDIILQHVFFLLRFWANVSRSCEDERQAKERAKKVKKDRKEKEAKTEAKPGTYAWNFAKASCSKL